MGSVRVAIVGVGNCATSLIQGVHYYRDADPNATVPGLMHVTFGDYHVSDVEFVAAFDVDDKKVGKDLSEAINASENNTIKICEVPTLGIEVQRGHTLDGLGKYYRETIEESAAEPVDIVAGPQGVRADVLVSYLPVGSEEADKFYAQCAIDAEAWPSSTRCPVFIASDPEWAKKFEDAGVPIVGDDIKSQVGATITHRVLAKLFEDRGVTLDRTYQLNVGGNMDFKNMQEPRAAGVQEGLQDPGRHLQPHGRAGQRRRADRNVHIGPSDYVAWLDDRKWAYVRLEGRNFGDVPLNLEYKLEVWDSPNSAGIIIDAIRAAKIAKDRGIGGPIISASSYLMKSPPVQLPDDEGRARVEAFIKRRGVASSRCSPSSVPNGRLSTVDDLPFWSFDVFPQAPNHQDSPVRTRAAVSCAVPVGPRGPARPRPGRPAARRPVGPDGSDPRHGGRPALPPDRSGVVRADSGERRDRRAADPRGVRRRRQSPRGHRLGGAPVAGRRLVRRSGR